MKLVHYYKKGLNKLRSITEEYSDDIVLLLSEQQGRAFNRFKNFEWYIKERKETEQWLNKEFVEKGGLPEIKNPRYFIVGENKFLEECYGANTEKITLDWDDVPWQKVSFTLDDSVKINVDNKEKIVLTKDELLEYAIKESGSLEEFIKMKEKNNEYVEAQVWSESFLCF